MAKFQLSGADGAKFEVDAPDEATALEAFHQHQGGGAPAEPAAPAPAAFDPTDPRFTREHQSVGAVLRGVPVLGAGLEKAGAGISALAHPLTGVGSDKTTIAERYVDNLEQEEAAKASYERAHPIENAVAGTIGGTLALGGAGGASPAVAKALGMTGSLVPAAIRGAASGAAIGGADALAHGEDPTSAATIGGLTGAGGVVAGKAAGKVWDAAKGMFRSAPLEAVTLDVNGRAVPVRQSGLTGDLATSQEEQAVMHGARGDPASRMAQEHTALSDEGMAGAHEDLAASLDPTGTMPKTSPQAAGEAVSAELGAGELQRSTAEAQELGAVTAERARIKKELKLPTSQPDQQAPDLEPRAAADEVASGLRAEASKAASARDAAYDELAVHPGGYEPAVFDKTATKIRTNLNAGTDPVNVDSVRTPITAEALNDIETNVGQRRFENQVEPPPPLGPDGRPVNPPITLQTIDTARKRLISMQRQANSRARATGDFSDARGVRRVINEFDKHVRDATRTPGAFSGDAEAALATMDNAHKLHSDLKKTFGPQNPQDDVGKAIEKIVGRRDVAPAETETTAKLLYGNQTNPGGPLQSRVARRVKAIVGDKSPAWTAYRKGMVSHLTDAPAGLEPMSNEKIADRVHKFFGGPRGVGLTHEELFSPSETAKMIAHANRVRGAAHAAPSGPVEKIIAKWSGRDGGVPASAKTVIDGLMGASGKKGMAPQIVAHLKTTLTPKGFTQLKQGVFSRITEPPEGMIDWGHQKQAQRIHDFINGDGKGLAEALFDKAELKRLANIARGHSMLLPVPGSTNPSGSAHAGARLARSAAHSLLPFVGLHAGGLPGAAAAIGIDKIAGGVLDRRAAAKAVKLFYGPQKSRIGPASTMPQRFGALGGQLAANQSR